MIEKRLSAEQRACLRSGVAALKSYMAGKHRLGLDSLGGKELLLVRSTLTLVHRLEACYEYDMIPNWAMFSPADLCVLDELMKAVPQDYALFTALQGLLVRHSRS